jgi:hypothetical protein
MIGSMAAVPSSEEVDTLIGAAPAPTAGLSIFAAEQQQQVQVQPLLSVGSSRLADVLNGVNTQAAEEQAAAESSGEWLPRSLPTPSIPAASAAASAAATAASAAARVGGVLASSSLGVLHMVESTAMTPAARRTAVAGLAAAAGIGTTAAAAGIGTTAAAAAAGGAALVPAVVGFTGSALLWSARQMAAAAQGTAHAAMNAALFLPRTVLWAANGMIGAAQAPATAPATPAAIETAAAAAPAARSAMPQLPLRTAAKGAAGSTTAAAPAPAAGVAVTVTAAPGALSVLGVLRLMFWQLPWSVAVASFTAWGWLLSQLVVAPAGMLFNYATQRSTPAVTYTAGAAPAASSVQTGTAGVGQAGQTAASWPSSAAVAPGAAVNGVPAGVAVTYTDSASSGVQAAGGVGVGDEAVVETVEAKSPRVGSMRWLLRGRATGQVPPTLAPSLEVRGRKQVDN